jgi:prepilin-type N-terminal cleavage/methylation domain-containing protein
MRSQGNRLRAAVRGFSLVELAVVMSIVAFLMGGLMYTLSAQVEQRNFDDTRRRLDQARELLLSFAIVKGRLPCPATTTSAGDESFTAGVGTACSTYYGGVVGGWLPARAIGYQQVDSGGYAVDAWGNRIRYVVSATTWGTTPFARFTKQHVSGDATAAWALTNVPGDLVICASASGVSSTSCNTAASVTNQNALVAIIFSTGKNGALTCATCTDELANNGTDQVFVYHTPASASATGGEFDDQFTWITVGELYGKLIAAGQLP